MTRTEPTSGDLAHLRSLLVAALAEADRWDSVAAAHIAAALDRVSDQLAPD